MLNNAACDGRWLVNVLVSFPVALQAYQVDWEAILARSADPFIASVSPWLYPPAARGEPNASLEHGHEFESLPPVKDVLSTARRRLDALNAC